MGDEDLDANMPPRQFHAAWRLQFVSMLLTKQIAFHLPMQSGNATYTCDDGTLENPITTVCLPTCAAVNCSEYSANGIPMQYKNDVNLTETCDNLGGNKCKATCCAPSMELT
jgi:hypothetical protein